jgi:NAD(P)-dependent dehydrogenase (short-subunit alcohol dehydrogenase family)
VLKPDVSGLRTLVVGGSSGIGRELVAQLVDRGACVVAAARRVERLKELDGAFAVGCDVRRPSECEELVDVAATHLGGLDAVVYAAGIGKFTPLDTAGHGEWLEILETNLIGAAVVTRAALSHLQEPASQGRALFLTSDSAERCYPGLVAYGASKAALSRFTQGLRAEFPKLRVSDVMVGPTGDTGVADHMDPEMLGYWVDRWYSEGWVRFTMQTPADVAQLIMTTLAAGEPAPLIAAHGQPESGAKPL